LWLTCAAAQVSEVKNIMMENIEKVLDRGEKLEVLVDKTESLRYQADQFQKSGKALRNKMWWQNIKMKLLVGLIVAIVIVVIFCFACFSGGRDCTKRKSSRRMLLSEAEILDSRRMLLGMLLL
jgi:vesicle-associated membrane protein 72